MATHSSVLAWRISGTGEPGGLPSLGLHRVVHDWSDLAAAAAKGLTAFICHFVSITSSIFLHCWGYLVPAPSSTHPPLSGCTRAVKIKMVGSVQTAAPTTPTSLRSHREQGFCCHSVALSVKEIRLLPVLDWALQDTSIGQYSNICWGVCVILKNAHFPQRQRRQRSKKVK